MSRLKMMVKSLVCAARCVRLSWFVFGLALAGSAAQAQTTAAKPAPKAGDGKTLAIGGGAGGGPILSREELRACLKQEQDIRGRLEAAEAGRGPLDKEKEALTADQQALKAERAPIDALKIRAETFAARLKDFSNRVADWTKRVEAHNADKTGGRNYDRNQELLNKERDGFTAERAELETERVNLSMQNQELVKAYNAKAQAVDARVAAWNQRNAAWNETRTGLERERQGWVASCADRRYREDDEIAIKAGK
jgi:hypothetical protein